MADEKRRNKKKVLANVISPPDSPDSVLNVPVHSSSIKRGRPTVLRNRSKTYRGNQKLKEEVMALKRKVEEQNKTKEKYKKRYQRLMKNNDEESLKNTPNQEITPSTRAKRIVKELNKEKLVRKLTFHEALCDSIKGTYQSKHDRPSL